MIHRLLGCYLIEFFFETHNIGNNANIGSRDFTMWKQKKNSSNKMLPPSVSIKSLDFWFQVKVAEFPKLA